MLILAFAGISSLKIFTGDSPSMSFLPRVFCAIHPTIRTVLLGLAILLKRWCFIRPNSHIPEAEMMMHDPGKLLRALESSTSRMNCTPSFSRKGSWPCSSSSHISSSKHSG